MNLRTLMLSTVALACAIASPASADVSFQITEVYTGVTGEDGTEDWFEITNVGDMVGDTGTLFYDDESMDPTVNAQLDSFMLAPGESAIFLVDNSAAAVADFNAIWGGVANVGLTNGGGGLNQSGDGLFLFDGNTAGANVVESVDYDGSFENLLIETQGDLTQIYATIQFTNSGNAFASSTADGLSNTFFNDNLNSDTNLIRLAGNPGSATIPEPASAVILGLACCGLIRRRR